MKSIFIICMTLMISVECFSQSGWFQQNSGTTANLYSVKFINSQTGWCVGDNGLILRTTDGGLNWIIQNIGLTVSLRSLSFPSSSTGYIAGLSGVILKTTNAGINWTNLRFQSRDLNCIFFIDNNNGFLGGDYTSINLPQNKFFRTFNGGITWDSIASYDNITSLFFLNPNLGWVTCTSTIITSEYLIKTTNGGNNFSIQATAPNGFSNIRSVFFIDSLNGWMGSPRMISPPVSNNYKTTNGGNNWIPATPISQANSLSIYFIDFNKGWLAAKDGLIQYSSNSGVSWTSQTNFISGFNYWSICFTDSLIGWCVGDNGRILKTTTGGLTYTSNPVSEIPSKYFLSQNYPNPFNPNTIINYELRITGFTLLKVYDVLGNEVATLVYEKKSAGKYEVDFNGSNLPSGIYFYRLEVDGNVIDTKRMVLVK